MIAANLMVVFPLLTTPWWIWAMVILAMLAVLGVSILISTRSSSENPPAHLPEHTPGQQTEAPETAPEGVDEPAGPEAHAAPRTAEFDGKNMRIDLPEGGVQHVPAQQVEAPSPDLLLEEIEGSLRPAAPAVGSDQDDLKLVRGISPSTAAVLHQAGIHTFAQLAETDAGDLEKILRAAGMRTVDSQSWPEQAQLAAAGDWNALGELQERLKEKK